MLPFVYQELYLNVVIAIIFYGVFILTAKKLNVQGLSLIQICHSFIRLAILSVLAIWVYGLFGGWFMLAFALPTTLISFAVAFTQTRRSVPLNGFLLMLPFIIFSLLLVLAIEAGSTLNDWTTFHQDCPTVSVRELPERTERAFVVTNAEIKRQMLGHHTWESSDSDGNTTTHHAYFAPLVDEQWEPSDPVFAWVDLRNANVEWVGRLVREESSDEEWIAVRNAKKKHGLTGAGRQNGEQTYRIVESDEVIIQTVKQNRTYHLLILLVIMCLSSISLFWVRKDGAVSKRKPKDV
ncbi:MAG: hypothetical protein VXZ96_07075 [Myxococcota bacterium]|nr:hypothetical protein [Myxococcota bacterium]